VINVKVIERKEVKLQQGAKLNYAALEKAIGAQTLDKDHVLAVSSEELSKILGSKRKDGKANATLARSLRKKTTFDLSHR